MFFAIQVTPSLFPVLRSGTRKTPLQSLILLNNLAYTISSKFLCQNFLLEPGLQNNDFTLDNLLFSLRYRSFGLEQKTPGCRNLRRRRDRLMRRTGFEKNGRVSKTISQPQINHIIILKLAQAGVLGSVEKHISGGDLPVVADLVFCEDL